jgi:hypothetical protein
VIDFIANSSARLEQQDAEMADAISSPSKQDQLAIQLTIHYTLSTKTEHVQTSGMVVMACLMSKLIWVTATDFDKLPGKS